jgi:hypothetical protein
MLSHHLNPKMELKIDNRQFSIESHNPFLVKPIFKSDRLIYDLDPALININFKMPFIMESRIELSKVV